MQGTFETFVEDGRTRIELTPDDGAPISLLVSGDMLNVTADGKTSGQLLTQGQTGQTAAAMLAKLFAALMLVLMLTSCGSADEMRGMGEAANKAAGGDAGGRSGAIKSKIVGGYMPGDAFAPDVSAERNTTASTAGPTYSIGTVAAGGGADAMSKAIATDPIVVEIKSAMDAEKALPPETRSVERLAALRGELAARVREIGEQAVKASPQITVTGNTMLVIAPSATGTAPPNTTAEDVKAAGEIQGIIGALNRAKGVPEEPTSKPVE